ncbi:MAG TPA: hypothetical protein VGB89_11015 [Bacteroidota bacterium]
MTKAEAAEEIDKELSMAARARIVGNEGMVRVCARRAAGGALRFWLHSNPRHEWMGDVIRQLQVLSKEESVPVEVREAAARLTTRVTPQFESPHSQDPLTDCKTIVDFLMQ